MLQPEQKVGLILARIHSLPQQVPPGNVVTLHARIVTGRNPVRPHARRQIEERVELDGAVAERTGDGGAAGHVLVDEGPDDVRFEALLEVHDVVGNAEFLGHIAGVVDIVEIAAAPARGVLGELRETLLIPELHRHADDAVSLAAQQSRGRGAVHAPAHSHRDEIPAHGERLDHQPRVLYSL